MASAAVEIVVVNEPDIFKLVENVGVEIVGAVASTTLPVPVDVVVPVPPRATGNVPNVIAPASIELVAAPIVLLVRVSVVSLPTSLSVDVGRVRVPVLTIVAIMGAVSVLLVRISTVAFPTKVSVVVGRVRVPAPLTIVAIIGAVSVLLSSVCASDVPTTAPVGTTFAVSTTPVPFPTKNRFDVRVAAPVPPLATGKTPVIVEASTVTADHEEFPAPSVFRKVFAAPTVGGNARL